MKILLIDDEADLLNCFYQRYHSFGRHEVFLREIARTQKGQNELEEMLEKARIQPAFFKKTT